MTSQPASYHGYRFPPQIIGHAAWFYHRFRLSFRDAELKESAIEQAREADPAEVARRQAYGRTSASLMERTSGFDVLACPRCGGRLRLIALIEEAAALDRILRHLGLPTETLWLWRGVSDGGSSVEFASPPMLPESYEPLNDRSDLRCVFVRWRTKAQQANWIGFVDARSGQVIPPGFCCTGSRRAGSARRSAHRG
jgi:hypothetical protein